MMPQTSANYKFMGQCIYCGSFNQLTDEHIVPKQLGGTRVLKKASCEECRIKIHPIETKTLGSIRDIRYRLGIGSRRRNQRPTTLKASILTNWDGKEEVLPPGKNPNHIWKEYDLPFAEHITLLALPLFKRPGILRGLLAEDCTEQNSFIKPWFHITPFEQKEGKTVYVEMTVDYLLLVRMLAKIAHGFAVWEFGLKNVESLMPKLILGEDLSNAYHLIGGVETLLPPNQKHLYLEIAQGKMMGRPNYIFATVRFFADLGAPTYFIVVGKTS